MMLGGLASWSKIFLQRALLTAAIAAAIGFVFGITGSGARGTGI